MGSLPRGALLAQSPYRTADISRIARPRAATVGNEALVGRHGSGESVRATGFWPSTPVSQASRQNPESAGCRVTLVLGGINVSAPGGAGLPTTVLGLGR
jgi:hypothetical protein